jgi:hypothetical protein
METIEELLGTCWVLWGSDGCDFNTFWTSLKLVVGACTYGHLPMALGLSNLQVYTMYMWYMCVEWIRENEFKGIHGNHCFVVHFNKN